MDMKVKDGSWIFVILLAICCGFAVIYVDKIFDLFDYIIKL